MNDLSVSKKSWTVIHSERPLMQPIKRWKTLKCLHFFYLTRGRSVCFYVSELLTEPMCSFSSVSFVSLHHESVSVCCLYWFHFTPYFAFARLSTSAVALLMLLYLVGLRNISEKYPYHDNAICHIHVTERWDKLPFFGVICWHTEASRWRSR